MNKLFTKIENAKHIMVVIEPNPDANSLGYASALYTYLMRLEKKVSLYCVTKKIKQQLSFIPWFSKIRDSLVCSADFKIEIKDETCLSLYHFFKDNDIKINKKMATALYSGVLQYSNLFLSDNVDGTIFAIAKELIECGADYKTSNRFIGKYQTLAALRVKAIMLTQMTLLEDARVAVFLLNSKDLIKTDATDKDCIDVLDEALSLPTVKIAVLLKENLDLTLDVSIRPFNFLDFKMEDKYTLENGLKEVLKIIDGKF